MKNTNNSLSNTTRYGLVTFFGILLVIGVSTKPPIAWANLGDKNIENNETASVGDEEDFKKIYDEMRQAIMELDKESFLEFFAEDFSAVSMHGGRLLTRQQVADSHFPAKDSDIKLESVEYNELKIRSTGNYAVVTYIASMTGVMKGKKFDKQVRITDVWEKRIGRWVSIASHASST